MKKMLFAFAILTTFTNGFAQDVVNFEVGPYEVDYRGIGDYKYRLRNEVNLYDYYGLKRDTIVQKIEEPSEPVKSALQFDVFVSVPFFWVNGASNVWGIEGMWKQKIGKQIYFNAGLSAGLAINKNGDTYNYYKDWKDGFYSETMFEIGVPVSVEFCKLDRKKASLYGGIGVVPTFYMGAKDWTGESKSGILVAPKLDFGGYLPIEDHVVRLGIYYQHDINCSSGDEDFFKERIGLNFVGATIGLVF